MMHGFQLWNKIEYKLKSSIDLFYFYYICTSLVYILHFQSHYKVTKKNFMSVPLDISVVCSHQRKVADQDIKYYTRL